ncbi:MAG TPA: CcmD family protein [Vicinamibacterales bacterium]|nr:CcmD family protein [Vicinamibacterales bacterium]
MIKKAVYALLLVAVLGGTPAFAQTTPPKTPTAGQDDFVPVSAPINANDTIPAPRLVAIAYGFIWVVLFGYLWSVRSRLGRVEREMETVSRRVSAGRK